MRVCEFIEKSLSSDNLVDETDFRMSSCTSAALMRATSLSTGALGPADPNMYENVEVFLPIHEGINASPYVEHYSPHVVHQQQQQQQQSLSKFTSQIKIQTKSSARGSYSAIASHSQTDDETPGDVTKPSLRNQDNDNVTNGDESANNYIRKSNEGVIISNVASVLNQSSDQIHNLVSGDNLSFHGMSLLPPMHIVCTNNSSGSKIGQLKIPSEMKSTWDFRSKSTTSLIESKTTSRRSKIKTEKKESRKQGISVATSVSSTSLLDIRAGKSSRVSSTNQNRGLGKRAHSSSKLGQPVEVFNDVNNMSKSNTSLTFKKVPVYQERITELVSSVEDEMKKSSETENLVSMRVSKSMTFENEEEDSGLAETFPSVRSIIEKLNVHNF